MGHDLESLLDATGIGDMAGTQFKKTAAKAEGEAFDLSKLAEECRAAANSTVEHREAYGRQLVEKTAAVAVISKTVDEINEIIGDPVEKLANSPEAARFVHAALERGHSPADVATFLKQAGAVDFVLGKLRGVRAGARANVHGAIAGVGKRGLELSKRDYQRQIRDAVRGGDLNKQNRLIERIRRKFGDKDAARILDNSGVKSDVPAAKDLMQATQKPGISARVGSKSINVSPEGTKKLTRYGIPAAAGATGLAVGGRGDSGGSKRSGITVVRG